MAEDFLYKKEVNKSVLREGFGIEREYAALFLSRIQPLQRGEKYLITLLLDGRGYQAELKNLNNPSNRRKNDAYQIRYAPNGDFARALQGVFCRSYGYITSAARVPVQEGKRQFTDIPDELKEYLAIYTTEDPFVFACEPIILDEMQALKQLAAHQDERTFEAAFSSDVQDDTAGISRVQAVVSVRKLNRKIGQALKEHYGYRCQICGQYIGEKYGSKLVEAHHIDYFVRSLNNDMNNIMIVCPNHHGIIHDRNPVFRRSDCTFVYPNGYAEGLKLNDHLHAG